MSGLRHPTNCYPQDRGGVVVVVDMFLSVLSVILNLVTVSAIRERGQLTMWSVLLAHLCLSNLVSSVLVS